ncbi:MAG: endonuclease/exonuclease/phosphatase family protein [Bacteroidales bacterium]|nr:endonuclease/exonuclease/phosphatase family protein [Bacteroidales bacterium]
MKVFFRITILLLNIAAAIGLLVVYIGLYVSPAHFWYLALPGLVYPILLFINLLFILFWLFTKKKALLLISLLMIVVRFDLVLSFIHLPYQPRNLPDDSFKIMSYNVKNFGLYSWENNTLIRDQIFNLIKEEAPDIICMQEFFHSKDNKFINLDSILNNSKQKNHHLTPTTIYKYQFWGIAIFTQYPIISKGKLTFKETTNSIIWVDLKKDDKTIRVYNCHLQSFKMHEDYLKKMDDIPQNKQDLKTYKNILRQLKKGYEARSIQADSLSAHIKTCPYPYFVCGDFNDTPFSYTYNTIKNENNLNDSYKTAGTNMSGTYVGNLPSFRIDYILYSNDFKAFNQKVITRKLSDHYPISCSFVLNETAKK